MRTCDYCHNELPVDAPFCGSCGRVQSAKMPSPSAFASPPASADEFGTVVMAPSFEQGPSPESEKLTVVNALERELDPLAGRNLRNMNRSTPFPTGQPPQDRETLSGQKTSELVDRQRQDGAFFNRVFPPVVGTEQNPGGQGAYRQVSSAHQQSYFPPAPGNFTAPPFSQAQQPQLSSNQKKIPRLYMLVGAVVLIPLLVLGGIVGLGITIFSPVISLSGTTSVNPGDALTIHGRSFLANSTVILTVDDNHPVQMMSRVSPSPIFQQPSSFAQGQAALLGLASILSTVGTLKTSSNGTFDAGVMVDMNWLPGRHQLHAQEVLSRRSASLAFTILGQSDALPPASTVTPAAQMPVPTPTPTTHATSLPTPTATLPGTILPPANTPVVVPTAPPPVPTPTPTPFVASTLTSLTPNTLSLGTLTQGSTQTLASQTTLNASGNALVAWTATWNQQQAPWLQISPSSGQISTPGSQQIAVMASAGTLQPGNYSTTISFASPFNTQPLTLAVSFSVLGSCLKGTPPKLSFTANNGGPDPASQTVNIANCGVAGPWTAAVTTADGANWLAANPANGTLGSGATQAVTVSTAVVSTQLMAGTYTGTITFTSGHSQFQIAVKLTVQAAVNQSPPGLQVTPTSLNLTRKGNCLPVTTATGTMYTCQISLSSVNIMQPLTWAATPGKLTTATPASGILVPGIPIIITLQVSATTCPGVSDTVVFASATTSSVSVTLSC